MSIFLKLLLAHLLADFALQFDILYKLKLKNVTGHIWHAAIHFAVTLLLVLPYLNDLFIWIFITISAAIHLFQDILKYKYMLVVRKKLFFPIFMLDQIGHFTILSLIFLFPVSKRIPEFPDIPLLGLFYTDDTWTFLIVAFLLLTVCGNYIFHAFGVSYLNHQKRNHFISRFEILHGMVERMVIGGSVLFLSNPILWILAIGSGFVRKFLPQVGSKIDFVLSATYAVLVGFLLKLWI
jgi:hypothetical protein